MCCLQYIYIWLNTLHRTPVYTHQTTTVHRTDVHLAERTTELLFVEGSDWSFHAISVAVHKTISLTRKTVEVAFLLSYLWLSGRGFFWNSFCLTNLQRYVLIVVVNWFGIHTNWNLNLTSLSSKNHILSLHWRSVFLYDLMFTRFYQVQFHEYRLANALFQSIRVPPDSL